MFSPQWNVNELNSFYDLLDLPDLPDLGNDEKERIVTAAKEIVTGERVAQHRIKTSLQETIGSLPKILLHFLQSFL